MVSPGMSLGGPLPAPGPAGRRTGSSRGRRARTFGPLVGIAIAALLALVVLPSNFTLPNSTPSPQVAIAPVPPTLNHHTQQISNFTALANATQGNGLGSAASGGGGAGNVARGRFPNLGNPPGLPGQGLIPPSTKDCVDGRQTSDPLSPPCVAFYQGNNGGATYQGVTGSLVKVLFYYDCYQELTGASQGPFATPCGAIINLDNPPPASQRIPPENALIAWEKFFNLRYQTYNRHVQFWVQFATYDQATGLEDSTSQTEDAANAYAEVHPFAVIDLSSSFGGGGTGYVSYMNQHHVLVFGTAVGLSNQFYLGYPGLDYGYAPPIQKSASQYAQFFCSVLKGKPVDDVGPNSNPATDPPVKDGEPRKYGFIYTTDPSVPTLTEQAKLSIADIQSECGVTISATATYPNNGYVADTSTLPTYAIEAMAKFQQDGITTILWPAGFETKFSQAAQQEGYYPEWILGDDALQAANSDAQFQNQQEWAHAWIMTSQTYYPVLQDQICYREYRTVDQTSSDENVANYACPLYNSIRQLFTGIQVAGPDLTPQSIDEGFHAIPAVPSTNPQVPACFYPPNDYTCVQDDAIEWYNPNAPATKTDDGEPGSWQMVFNGKRFLPGEFPTSNLLALKNPNDVINNYDTGDSIDDAPPSP